MNTLELVREQEEMLARILTPAPVLAVENPTLEIIPAPSEDRSCDVDVYIRHLSTCKKRKSKTCGCPLWFYNRLTQARTSARTTDWTAAEKEAKKKAQSNRDVFDPEKRELNELKRKREYESISIEDAIKKYVKDCESRGLGDETIEAYECAVRQMKEFAHGRVVFLLGDITPELLKDWRSAGPDKKKSAKQKKQRQLKTFFKFCCEQMHWLDINANPALALTKIVGEEEVAAVPFYEDQYNALLDATYIYEDSKRFRDAAVRLRALIQLMRWSGLAIRDALTLPRWRIDAHGVLKARRTKTKTWVTIPLPLQVVEELRALKNENPEYFFWSGTAKPRVLVGDYNRMFRRLRELVKWPRPVEDGDGNPVAPHSHMLRHTFAYHWLNSVNPVTGQLGDIRDLQLLLGHKRLATTEKHYAGFMPDQAERLNAEVRARHAAQNAPGVAKQPQPVPEHRVRVPLRRHAVRR